MTTPEPSDGTSTPLDESSYPLAFVADMGLVSETETHSPQSNNSYRCEVMGLGKFQKEGLVEDVATGRSWRLVADEGKYLRGTDMAPAPLMHWAAGLHADVTFRIAHIASREGIELSRLAVTVSQGFASQGSFARGEAVALVFDLNWEIAIKTNADDETIQSIVDEALASAPAHTALKHGAEGSFALYTNGRATLVTGVPQSTAPAEVDPFLRHPSRPRPADGAAMPGQLLLRRPSPGVLTIELNDNQTEAIGWHVQATGEYRFESRLVASTVGFPEAGASLWTLVSDDTGMRAPSPLAYFSIGTAFCYHTQLCRYVDVRRMPLASTRLVQLSGFASDDATSIADPVDTHLFVNGSVDEAQATSLLVAAANTCYAHRALSVNVTSNRQIHTTVSPLTIN